jgi:hypothetical protein
MRPTLQQLLETMTTLTEVQVFIGLPTTTRPKAVVLYTGPAYVGFEKLKDVLDYQVEVIKAISKNTIAIYIDK